MPAALPFDALVTPADLGVADDDDGLDAAVRACVRAAGEVEAHLERRLGVGPDVLTMATPPALRPGYGWGGGVEWARRWPVSLLIDPLTGAEIEGAAYAVEAGEVAVGDARSPSSPYPLTSGAQGEEVGLPAGYARRTALVYGGYRRADHALDAVNAGLAAAHPRYQALAATAGRQGQLTAEAWGRVPLAPPDLLAVLTALARGHLQAEGAGLGALSRRQQGRGEREATVQLDAGWRERELDRIGHYRPVDFAV